MEMVAPSYVHFLCRLARRWRMSAFFLAEPEPCAPVAYAFFLALVFTLACFPDVFFAPPENTMPPMMTWSMSSPPKFAISKLLGN